MRQEVRANGTAEATRRLIETARELREWAAAASPGTMLPAAELAAVLEDVEDAGPEAQPEPVAQPEPSWRVLLWTVPPETRIGVPELAEALGRPRSYIYRRTGPKAENVIPHRRLDGILTFVVGEVREWIRATETIEVVGPTDAVRSPWPQMELPA